MKRGTFNSNDGISLIELIIVMALIGMVIIVVFSMFFFGNNTFTMSRNQFDVQSDIRLAMDTIVKEVRFAAQIEIIDANQASDPNQHEDGYGYFYFKNGKLYHTFYNEDTNQHKTIAYNGTFELDSSLFRKISSTTLGIKVISEYGGQAYKGETEIDLLNLNSENSIVGNNQLGLKYKKNLMVAGIDDNIENPDPDPESEPEPEPEPDPEPESDPEHDYPQWNSSQAYPGGSYVLYKGRIFYALYYAKAGVVPDSMSDEWNEITDEWRNFNTYVGGEVVLYNGKHYKAKWWTRNDKPDISNVWELLD